MRFAINDDEWDAMAGLSYLSRVLYMELRRRMDFATGMVGVRPKISRQALAEGLYVEHGQGKSDCGSPSPDAIRWGLKKLTEAGLIETIPADRQLVFRLVLADMGLVREKEVHPSYTRPTPDQVHPTNPQHYQGELHEVHAMYTRQEPEEVPHTSGNREQELPNPSLRSGAGEGSQPTRKPRTTGKADDALQAACRATWGAYSDAYQERYGTQPVRNQKVNSQVKAFVQRLAHTEAPEVAAFYVGHSDGFYARKMHDFGSLLADAEKLRTEWATGRHMTQTKARQMDRAGNTLSLVDEIIQDRRAVA